MPLYEYLCSAGHRFERWLPLAQYGHRQTCDCGQPGKKLISAPMVRGDLEDYVSPVTGRLISGRRQRAEDLKQAGCVEYDPGMRTDYLRRRKAEDEALDRSVDETVEREIDAMPVRKKELLAQEFRAGADVAYVRK